VRQPDEEVLPRTTDRDYSQPAEAMEYGRSIGSSRNSQRSLNGGIGPNRRISASALPDQPDGPSSFDTTLDLSPSERQNRLPSFGYGSQGQRPKLTLNLQRQRRQRCGGALRSTRSVRRPRRMVLRCSSVAEACAMAVLDLVLLPMNPESCNAAEIAPDT